MAAAITRVLKLAAAGLAAVLYVWFAAVRALPLVKARKRVRRSTASRTQGPPAGR